MQEGGSLTIAGNLTITGNSVEPGAAGDGTAGSAFGSGIFIQGTNTIAFSPETGETQTVSDVIADQTGSGGSSADAGEVGLSKNGAGTLVLGGTNTYTGGTTVHAGTLIVDGATSSGFVLVHDGATLRGSGTIGSIVAIESNGRLSPTGVLHTGFLTMHAGAQLAISLHGTTPGSGYDQVAPTGWVRIVAGARLSVAMDFTPAAGDVFTIVENDGMEPVAGEFEMLPNGATLAVNGRHLRVNYGNDVTLTVLPETPAVAANASAGVAFGGSIHDTATITGGLSPTGTVTFRAYGPGDASCSLAPAFTGTKPLSGGPSISSDFTPAAAGVYRWIAVYNGDINNAPSATACDSAGQTVTIAKASQTIGPITAPAAKTYHDAPFPASAAATSSLLVSFSSQTPGVRTVSGSIVTIVSAGTCTIAADQSGDGNYNPAAQATLGIPIAQASQTITFDPLGPKLVDDLPFPIGATASSSLAVTFASQTPAICTVSGATVTLHALGTCTIAASQDGNGNYNAAADVPRSFTVAPNCAIVSAGPTQLALGVVGLPYSQAFSLTGGPAPASFTIAGALPAGLTFSNGTISGTPTARGAFPVAITATDANACQATVSVSLAITAERRLVVGAGTGGPAIVRAFTVASPILTADFTAFASPFTGGVSVAQGDVDGDGVADIITGAGPGANPTVAVFGAGGVPRLAFLAFEPTLRAGIEVAAGDITGDACPRFL